MDSSSDGDREQSSSQHTTLCPPTSDGSMAFILEVPPETPEAIGVVLLTSLNELDNLLDRATSTSPTPNLEHKCSHPTAADLTSAAEELSELRADAMELYDLIRSEVRALADIVLCRERSMDLAAASETVHAGIARTEQMYEKAAWPDRIAKNTEVNEIMAHAVEESLEHALEALDKQEEELRNVLRRLIEGKQVVMLRYIEELKERVEGFVGCRAGNCEGRKSLYCNNGLDKQGFN